MRTAFPCSLWLKVFRSLENQTMSQSAGMGETCGAGFTAICPSRTGASSHFRTSGNAFCMAASPTSINSSARLKSSYSNPATSGSTTRSAADLQIDAMASCAIANDCPITANKCFGAPSTAHVPFRWTASTRSAPISRSGCVGTGCDNIPSTRKRPRMLTGRNIPGYAQLARTGSMISPE